MKKRYDLEARHAVLEQYKEGKSFNEISLDLLIPASTVWRWIKSEGVVNNPEVKWAASDEEKLASLWPVATKEDLLNTFSNRTWNALKYKASSLGIRRDVYFDNIKRSILDYSKVDTEEKAYILGFIAADGSIRCGKKGNLSMKIGIAKQDVDHLVRLKNILCPNAVIKEHRRKKAAHQNLVEFYVNDTKFCKDLIALGITPRKSKTLGRPKKLNTSLFHHFIRGLFDGDGSFWHTGGKIYASIDGSEEILSWVNEQFRQLYPHKCKVYVAKGCHRVQYGHQTARNFASYIYKNSSLHLDRKYSKVKDLI